MCTRTKIADHVKIEDLHARCNITTLEQRLRIQLLLLMYKKSKDIGLHRVYPRNTRASHCIVFKRDHYVGTLYKHSPYFVGAKLWDSFEDIDVPCIF